VNFPAQLSMDDFMYRFNANDGSQSLYSLYGVVEHQGSFGGGHYVAYVRVREHWFYFSDTSIRRSSLSEVLSAEAYMLYYEKMESKL
jgi:ubiquitin C-terminal hydrolase